jgi:type II secretory pathway predicted ATPase ExeA
MDLEACYDSLGFKEPPFRITPDTDYFFPHPQYLTAIGNLRYGMLTGSFAVITGEVGLGKTLLCRYGQCRTRLSGPCRANATAQNRDDHAARRGAG